MSEKRRLGKGLGALIPDVLSTSEESNQIELSMIKPNPYQPRREFDEEKLKELATSIKNHGILQAVVVTKAVNEDGYYLVAGERRCRAAKIAGLLSVPAVVKDIDKATMLEIALIENLQREDLNPVEEAQAYRRLMKEYGYTQEELANRLGKSRSAIANSKRLLALPDKVLGYLEKGDITAGQARPLLALDSAALQVEAALKIVEEGLTARDVERLANEKKKRAGEKPETALLDPLRQELQVQMQRELGTKVKLKDGKSGGTIEIYYYSEEDLERLVSMLLPKGI